VALLRASRIIDLYRAAMTLADGQTVHGDEIVPWEEHAADLLQIAWLRDGTRGRSPALSMRGPTRSPALWPHWRAR
jgi:hypothetical protein